eukprot:scaffold85392_cov30-Tisochrysis_lutea.AAC.4
MQHNTIASWRPCVPMPASVSKMLSKPPAVAFCCTSAEKRMMLVEPATRARAMQLASAERAQRSKLEYCRFSHSRSSGSGAILAVLAAVGDAVLHRVDRVKGDKGVARAGVRDLRQPVEAILGYVQPVPSARACARRAEHLLLREGVGLGQVPLDLRRVQLLSQVSLLLRADDHVAVVER